MPDQNNIGVMGTMSDQRQSIMATGYAVISIQHHDNPAQQRLLSIRASKLDAYRSLMEQVYGQYLDANTTVAEMVVESDSFRARVQGVIYGLGAVALVAAHVASGVFNRETAQFSAALLIPAGIGMFIGLKVQDRVDQATFRKATLAVLFIAGLNLVRRAVM